MMASILAILGGCAFRLRIEHRILGSNPGVENGCRARGSLSLSSVCICRNMAEPCRAESTDAEVGEPVAEARTWLVIEARLKATIRRCWEDAVRLSEWEMHPEDQCSTPTLTTSSMLNQLKSEQN